VIGGDVFIFPLKKKENKKTHGRSQLKQGQERKTMGSALLTEVFEDLAARFILTCPVEEFRLSLRIACIK
jgi:hypothetical protein